MISRRVLLTCASAAAVIRPARATTLPPIIKLSQPQKQGSLVVGQALVAVKKISVDGAPVSVSTEGWFAFGVEYDRTKAVQISVELPDGSVNNNTSVVPLARHYDVQHINGLPPQEAHPTDAAIVARIKRENAMVAEVRKRDTQGTGFSAPFDWPVPGIISSLFGSQRILNGVATAPHFGVDIAAPANTAIHAPADGTVALAEPDFFLTGGTTVVDHGHGVFTSYVHQNTLKVAVGQAVKRGAVIGLVGMKGRATGPHLHWGLNWFQMRLDPSLSTRTPAPAKA